jgi:hypothetical protein
VLEGRPSRERACRPNFDRSISPLMATKLPRLRLERFFALLLLGFIGAACGSSPTAPSGTGVALQSVTVVTSSGGGVVLHRDETATGTVRLNGNAPAGGAVVALTVDGAESRALIVPAAVTIPAGSSSATFPVTVTSSGVSSPAEVTLNAVYRDVKQSFVIRLEPLR